jgi:transcription termination/antitermination protein NusG
MDHQWYVLQVYSNYEKKVQKMLEERIKITGLSSSISEIVVPIEEVIELKKGEKKTTERKFFPGYVLIKMKMDSDVWHFIKSVPNVMGFLGGTADKPSPISDNEALRILNQAEDSKDMPRPTITYQPGEVVRVIDGPFNDFNGVVENVNYDKSKLSVAVQILGRPTPVDLNFNQVEKS